ncbi:MAG: hypothetical protein IJ173_00665 [Kiritimatiellae bacterium]|nr:hypothetical protein [Kiritimatiellia bacterium]
MNLHKIVMSIAFVTAVGTIMADTNTQDSARSKFPADIDERIAMHEMRRNGGWVLKPGTGRGYVAILNRQTNASDEAIQAGIAVIQDQYKVDIKILTEPKFGAVATIELVSNGGGSTVVWYPDEMRTVVDIDALAKDSPDKSVLDERVKKQIVRAFGISLGGGYVCASKSPLSPMKTLNALDNCDTYLEMDMRFQQNSEAFGLKPYDRVTYRQAVQEGWAPAPKDKYQKRIWNQVRQLPTNPLLIEFDPKRGK